MRNLDLITLVCIDSQSPGQALLSLKKSLSQIIPARTILFTHLNLQQLPDGIEHIVIPILRSKQDYSRWVLRDLYRYIETPYVLVTQWDGYVLDGDRWLDEYYDYDYIGAPWIYEHGRNVGNGGFSLRSRRLCEILATDPAIEIVHPEDQAIGIFYRAYLEQTYRMRFPEEALAECFAFELRAPIQETFGFHGFHHPGGYHPPVLIRRRGALGDVIALEPVLRHFHEKGCMVILDTESRFFELFLAHNFKIHRPDEVDPRILEKAQVISLDMAYEVKPRQLHLRSYYEACGIEDGELRNPRLSMNFNPKDAQARLFPKYVVVHVDERPQQGRNIYGIRWARIVDYCHAHGYDVIQIGEGLHERIHMAVEMRNMNLHLLMRVIGGAHLFIGVDSGPANIAVAMQVPAILFFGSVEPTFIFPDLSRITVVQREKVCRLPKCWHSVVGCEGIACVEMGGKEQQHIQMFQGIEVCVETDDIPPCADFETTDLLKLLEHAL